MGVSGPTGDLRKLGERFRKLGTPAGRAGLTKVLGETARTQCIKGFKASVDPYGTPWKPIKNRAGQPLIDTGRLKNSFHADSTAGGFGLSTEVQYAAAHQEGATIRTRSPRGTSHSERRAAATFKLPRRQMVPDAKGLGTWQAPLERAADRYVRMAVGA